MSGHVSAEETPTGWRVEVRDAEFVIIETDGPRLSIGLAPDDDDTPTPLAVSLGEPA